MATTSDPDLRLALRLALAVLCATAYFFGGAGWNQNAHFDLTRAIVERGTLAIDGYSANTGDVSYFGGRVYANKAPGLSFFAVPVYSITRAVASLQPRRNETPAERDGDDAGAPGTPVLLHMYAATVALCGGAAAAISAALYLYGRRVVGLPARTALGIAAVAVVATPAFPYATMFFAHLPSGALLLAALLAARRDGTRSAAAAGLAAGGAAFANYLCLPAMAVVAARLLMQRPRPARALAFAAGAALPLAALAAYHWVAFGAPWATPIPTTNPMFLDRDAVYGVFRLPRLDAAWGITFSEYRGLFALSPLLLLASAGLYRAWRSAERRADALAVAAIGLGFFAANASFNGWNGGDAIGPRYLVAVVPLAGLLLLEAAPLPRWLWIACTGVSLALVLAATAVDPMPPEAIARPLTAHVLPVVGHARVPAHRVLPELARLGPQGPPLPAHLAVQLERSHVAARGAFNWGDLVAAESAMTLLLWLALAAVAGIGLWRGAARVDSG